MKPTNASAFTLALLTALGQTAAADAQATSDLELAAVAVAEAALDAITNEDEAAFTDLMIDEAILFPVSQREGRTAYSVRTRAAVLERGFAADITERGFGAQVRVSGPIAMVWLPYDLYIDDEWSHCGVDVFTMVRLDDQWKISSMSWSVLQPPACEPHPDGPPAG